jgi:hypothetical protein
MGSTHSNNSETIVRDQQLLVMAAENSEMGQAIQDEEIVSGAFQVSKKYCVQLGTEVRLAKEVTFQYLKKHSSIPVPKVYCTFKNEKDNTTYIVRECINGEPIGENWADKSEAEKERLMAQVKTFFNSFITCLILNLVSWLQWTCKLFMIYDASRDI